MTMLNQLSRLVHRAFGSNRLRSHEKVCIASWRSALPEAARRTLDEQLTKLDYVQRQAGGMKTVFYSVRDPGYESWSDTDFFSLRGEEQKVFVGSVSGKIGDVTKSIHFSIYVHRGRLSSIEFSSEPSVLGTMPEDELAVEDSNVLINLSK
jgi:hypothetical protein